MTAFTDALVAGVAAIHAAMPSAFTLGGTPFMGVEVPPGLRVGAGRRGLVFNQDWDVEIHVRESVLTAASLSPAPGDTIVASDGRRLRVQSISATNPAGVRTIKLSSPS